MERRFKKDGKARMQEASVETGSVFLDRDDVTS